MWRNLFARAKALNTTTWEQGEPALAAFATFNTVAAKPVYGDLDKAAMLVALETLQVLVRDPAGVEPEKKGIKRLVPCRPVGQRLDLRVTAQRPSRRPGNTCSSSEGLTVEVDPAQTRPVTLDPPVRKMPSSAATTQLALDGA
jgi:hypothetical protein